MPKCYNKYGALLWKWPDICHASGHWIELWVTMKPGRKVIWGRTPDGNGVGHHPLVCACVRFVNSCSAWISWVQFFILPVFLADEMTTSTCEICVTLHLCPNRSVPLEQIHMFKTIVTGEPTEVPLHKVFGQIKRDNEYEMLSTVSGT